jgi:hypothetical protein
VFRTHWFQSLPGILNMVISILPSVKSALGVLTAFQVSSFLSTKRYLPQSQRWYGILPQQPNVTFYHHRTVAHLQKQKHPSTFLPTIALLQHTFLFPFHAPKSIIPPLSPAALTEWQTPHGGCVHSTHITLHTRSLSILKKTWHLQLPYRIPTLAPGRSPQI